MRILLSNDWTFLRAALCPQKKVQPNEPLNLRSSMRVNPTAVRPSRKTDSGFSMIELMVVVAIILIITATVIPNIGRVLDDAKLRASAQELSGLYQEARMRAARDNTYYEVMATPTGQAPEVVWIDLNGDGQRDSNEPAVELPAYMTLSDAGGPANLTATKCGFHPVPSTNSLMYNQNDTSIPGNAWNTRGLPRQKPRVAATSTTLINGAGLP